MPIGLSTLKFCGGSYHRAKILKSKKGLLILSIYASVRAFIKKNVESKNYKNINKSNIIP